MNPGYVAGGVLYVAMLSLSLWIITRQVDFRDWLPYYKPDLRRGGYIGLDDKWVARKVIWREWRWHGVVLGVLLLSPFIVLYVVLWEGLMQPYLRVKVPAGVLDYVKKLFPRKEAPKTPVLVSGGDGSSSEAAIVVSADNFVDGIRAEYDFIQEKHGPRNVAWKRDLQMKVAKDGRDYDVLTIELADGTKKPFWFDITSFFGTPKEASSRPWSDFDPAAFFGDSPDRPAAIAKLGAELMSALPRCTAKIVAAGPSYGDESFADDLIVDAAGLLPWAEYFAASGYWTNQDECLAAVKTLPVWLKRADLTNRSPTYVTGPFRQHLSDHCHTYGLRQIAEIHCPQCGQSVPPVIVRGPDARKDEHIEWATKEWRCAAGHLLRRK